jgi:integron integrase
MGKTEIEAFLSHLAIKQNVSASTQRQALNAIIFLYNKVLFLPLNESLEPVRSKRHPRPPVVMSQGEMRRVLSQMEGTNLLMARLLYGSGLRLMECIRLRVQNVDLERSKLYVRAAKGNKDRVTVLPQFLKGDLQDQLEKVRRLHEDDLSQGYGSVYLPNALARKYPKGSKDFRWQYVFPAKKLSKDPRTGVIRRHHILESSLQKAVRSAANKAGITKRIGCHTFRHSFATHMLENGINIRVVQELMGHADVKTTEIYTHVMEKDISVVMSPLDALHKG